MFQQRWEPSKGCAQQQGANESNLSELWMLAFKPIPLAISKQSIFEGDRSSLSYEFYHHYL